MPSRVLHRQIFAGPAWLPTPRMWQTTISSKWLQKLYSETYYLPVSSDNCSLASSGGAYIYCWIVSMGHELLLELEIIDSNSRRVRFVWVVSVQTSRNTILCRVAKKLNYNTYTIDDNRRCEFTSRTALVAYIAYSNIIIAVYFRQRCH